MILLAALSLVVLAICLAFAPQGERTHAAISKSVFARTLRFPLAGLYRDTDGNRIDLRNSIIAKATGKSCECYGIADGAVVVAEKFDASASGLDAGDIVIINSPVADGSRPQRFRCVESVSDDGWVQFAPTDRDFKSKPLSDVLAKVAFVST